MGSITPLLQRQVDPSKYPSMSLLIIDGVYLSPGRPGNLVSIAVTTIFSRRRFSRFCIKLQRALTSFIWSILRILLISRIFIRYWHDPWRAICVSMLFSTIPVFCRFCVFVKVCILTNGRETDTCGFIRFGRVLVGLKRQKLRVSDRKKTVRRTLVKGT